MFEFDEHYSELEAIEAASVTTDLRDINRVSGWRYVGNDVWTLDVAEVGSGFEAEWAIETAEVA